MSMTCSKAKRGSSRKVVISGTIASARASATSSPYSIRVAMIPGSPDTSRPRVSSRPAAASASATANSPGAADLLLELHDAVHQGLGGRRASRHVHIHRHDAIAAAHDGIGVVIVAAAVGAASHADYPARLRHLVVH